MTNLSGRTSNVKNYDRSRATPQAVSGSTTLPSGVISTEVISPGEPKQNTACSSPYRIADEGPVVITDRGKPAYVLMRHEAYETLSGAGRSILDLLAHPASDDIEFDPEPLEGSRIKVVDLS